MAEVRVRLPLGAFQYSGVWESLAIRLLREQEIVGSNPTTPDSSLRWGLCWYRQAPVKRAPSQVRFLPPQLRCIRKGKPMGDGSCLENSRAMSLEGSTPSPSASMCPWPSGKGASLPSWTGGFDSRRALSISFGDRLTVGCLALNQAMEVRILLPELRTITLPGSVAAGSDA